MRCFILRGCPAPRLSRISRLSFEPTISPSGGSILRVDNRNHQSLDKGNQPVWIRRLTNDIPNQLSKLLELHDATKEEKGCTLFVYYSADSGLSRRFDHHQQFLRDHHSLVVFIGRSSIASNLRTLYVNYSINAANLQHGKDLDVK